MLICRTVRSNIYGVRQGASDGRGTSLPVLTMLFTRRRQNRVTRGLRFHVDCLGDRQAVLMRLLLLIANELSISCIGFRGSGKPGEDGTFPNLMGSGTYLHHRPLRLAHRKTKSPAS